MIGDRLSQIMGPSCWKGNETRIMEMLHELSRNTEVALGMPSGLDNNEWLDVPLSESMVRAFAYYCIHF